MICQDVRELLSAYCDAETSVSQARDIRAHLFTCASCQAEHDEMVWLKMAVNQPVPQLTEADGKIERCLMACVASERPSRVPVLRSATLVAASFCLAFVAWSLFLAQQRQAPSGLASDHDLKFETDRYRASEELNDPFSPVPTVLTSSYGHR